MLDKCFWIAYNGSTAHRFHFPRKQKCIARTQPSDSFAIIIAGILCLCSIYANVKCGHIVLQIEDVDLWFDYKPQGHSATHNNWVFRANAIDYFVLFFFFRFIAKHLIRLSCFILMAQ